MKRRSFLKLALALPLASRALAAPASPAPAPLRSGEGPYTGDEFSLAHRYLRDAQPLPAPAEDPRVRDVLVVGGGPAGLIAAWLMRDLDVQVLEKDRVPGGTSKSEEWNGVPYALGSAYFGVPERRTAIDSFYRSLGLHEHWREFGDRDMGIFRGSKWEVGFWERPERKAVADAFTAMNEHRYTDLPFEENEAWTRAEFEELDRISWSAFLARGLPVKRGAPLVPVPRELADFCEWFAPAVVSAKPDEVSAWAMLNQFLAEFGPLCALPGGNGFLTRRVVEALTAAGKEVTTGRLVTSIEDGGDTVRVVSIGPDGRAVAQVARAVVFAGPKFVAARVVKKLPAEQVDAISEMLYRPFMVANVMLNKPVMDRNVYDAYCKELPPESTLGDITFADYAARAKGQASVLTCYFPLPRDNARGELLDDSRLPGQKKQLVADLLSVLGPRGLTAADIADVSFTRWGHPMVVAKPGQLARGVFDRAAKAHGRVLFAHMDNHGSACIESSFAAAETAVSGVRARLPGKKKRRR